MATQLFLRNWSEDVTSGSHSGTNQTNSAGSAVAWQSHALSTTRGSSTTSSFNVATVAGATNGVDIYPVSSSVCYEWLSLPVAADITISGTMTFNIWASENNMSANVAINAVVERIGPTGAIVSTIIKTARTTEVAVTTNAVNNFTGTPTSTNLTKGDRIRVRIFGDDAGTMASGFTFKVSFSGPTASADGDTWIQFNENITFISADPTGTTLHLTSAITSSVESLIANYPEGNFTVADTIGPLKTAGDITGQTFKGDGGNLKRVGFWVRKVGSPTGNVSAVLYAHTGTYAINGTGTGSVQTTSTSRLASSLTTSFQWEEFVFDGTFTLGAGTAYAIGLTRDTTDASNYIELGLDDVSSAGNGNPTYLIGGSWLSGSADTIHRVYSDQNLTMWTSFGDGVDTAVTNTAPGWVSPIQLTTAAGDRAVEWFSKPLQAFTLSGPVLVNVWAHVSLADATTSIRAELAVCNGDGTGATVWSASTIIDSDAIGSQGAGTGAATGALDVVTQQIRGYLLAPNVSVTDGQRLRLRMYIDDSASAAMTTGRTSTFRYDHTTTGSGDSFITLGQSVAEFVTTKAIIALNPSRRIRHILVR